MRVALIGLLAMVATACASANYGDAAVDRGPLSTQNFDVDPTPDGGTPPMCPPLLYGRASEGVASCTRAPEICRSSSDASSAIECTCLGTMWECHEYRP